MRDYRQLLIDVDPLIKLQKVQWILSRHLDPSPSRPTIIGWIHEGKLEGKQIGKGQNWFVFESSLDKFVEKCQERLAA
ncbi:MAG TPA: hypothetical protein VMM38_01415 [Aridibacter sp.]|nr:hypothetical protein [Aridibacter sp.]